MSYFIINPSNLSPEMQLLLVLSMASMHEEDYERVRMLTTSPIDWEAFITLVDRHRVIPKVYRNLNGLDGNGVPEQIRRSLQNRFERNAKRSLALTAELVRLIKLLKKNGISVVPLKGPVLALQVYGDLGMRHAGDLDLLVAPEHIGQAEQLIRQEGYQSMHPDFSLSPRQQKVYTRQQHHFVYYQDNRKISMELHWRWNSNPYLFQLDMDYVWERGQTIDIAGTRMVTLPVEDLLLYLCTHGAKHAWFRIFWLCDVAELMHRNQSIDWAQMMKRAAELAVQRPLAQALVLSNLLLESPLPDLFRDYLERDRGAKSLVNVALRIIMQPTVLPSRPFTSGYILSKLHNFSLNRDFKYKLLVFQGQICTIPYDWQTVPLPDILFPLYYVLRPFMWFWRIYIQGIMKRLHIG